MVGSGIEYLVLNPVVLNPEGPHLFNLVFLASAFGHAGQMWPKANIFSIRISSRRPSA